MSVTKNFSEEEIQELLEWFRTHECPQSLRLDKATNIPDLKETISILIEQVEEVIEHPQLHGYVALLKRIKAKIENPS